MNFIYVVKTFYMTWELGSVVNVFVSLDFIFFQFH